MRNSDGGSGLAREERLQIMLSPKELEAVDNFKMNVIGLANCVISARMAAKSLWKAGSNCSVTAR